MRKGLICVLCIVLMFVTLAPSLAENRNIISIDGTISLYDRTFDVQLSITERIGEEEDEPAVDDAEPLVDVGYTTMHDPANVVNIAPGLDLIINEVILVLAEGATREDLLALLSPWQAEIAGEIPRTRTYQIRFADITDEDTLYARIDELMANEKILDVYLNNVREFEMDAIPNDPLSGSWNVSSPDGANWGQECVNAPLAWDYVDRMSPVKVGVLDSPVRFDHEDLLINPNRTGFIATSDFSTIQELWEFYDRTSAAHVCTEINCQYCGNGKHGTHVAGIIGAIDNNNKGVAGLNWEAILYSYSYFVPYINSSGQLKYTTTSMGLTLGLTQLVVSGCKVVNFSVGSAQLTDPNNLSAKERRSEESFTRQINSCVADLEAMGYDFLLVTSAGNKGVDVSRNEMKRCLVNGERTRAHTMVVGAVENAQNLVTWLADIHLEGTRIYNMAGYSNDGDLIDITAPGSNIYSTVYEGYEYLSGTSMAAPMVTAAASMLYGMDQYATYDQIKRILMFTCNDFCARDGEVYPILNVGAAVEWLAQYGLEPPEEVVPEYGFIKGVVNDASTGDPIANSVVSIRCREDSQYDASGTFENGNYEFPLHSGTYDITFSAQGYEDEMLYGVVVETGVIQYNVQLRMVSEEKSQAGTVSGQVINAKTGQAVPGASVSVFRGINSGATVAVMNTVCDSYGRYSFTLDGGNYTAVASADGFMDGASLVLVLGGETRENENITVTPILLADEMRIVLTWGQYPYDLDSHTICKMPSSSYHVYYSSMDARVNGTVKCMLDVDDQASYGPETTTVFLSDDATYSYYVHDYSNRDKTSSEGLGASSARVAVYLGDEATPRIFEVPVQSGTLWHVFNFENGVITPVNEMSYQYTPSYVGN